MKVGLSFLFMATGRDCSDLDVYGTELELASMAEPLGFDSVWATEHHFTEYSMIPNPLQFLAFMAGRTDRIELGSMVCVLPWHNPARLAGEISQLDNLSRGRLVLGLGRGLGRMEFEGLGADMSTSREVFDEAAEMIIDALEAGFFEYEGRFLKFPKRSIRPEPTRSFVGRTYGAAVSPESVVAMAKLGAGLIIIPQKPWPTVVSELELYRQTFAEHHDREAPAPVVCVHVMCDHDPGRAADLGRMYNSRYYHRVMEHYDLGGQHFATQKGYSYYAQVSNRIQTTGEDEAAGFYADLHVYGTPAQCIEKIEAIKAMTQCETILGFFSFSGMPYELSKSNLLLFSEEVRPTLQSMT